MNFKQNEHHGAGYAISQQEAIDSLKYNEDGLVPAIAVDSETNEVLMMAWMNSLSIKETLETGQVCYWSRSRQSYWRKGESSGHVQKLKRMRVDCDGDALLLEVEQLGAACHTFRRSCFYWAFEGDQLVCMEPPPEQGQTA